VTKKAIQRFTILIIDDDDQLREFLRYVLADEYTCTAAASAEEALTILNESEFDLVISDINMGGISGLDLVPHVHRHTPDTVVLMISGQQTIETAIAAMRAGAFDYIMKPLGLEQVIGAVERALNHRRMLVEKRRYDDELTDLIERRTAESERLAHYDTLTELPNRVSFEQRLTEALESAERGRQLLATLFVALDHFKKIDDTLGHAVGDELLVQVAQRLKGCVPEGASLACFDRDEFVMLLTRHAATDEAAAVARSFNETLKPPFVVAGNELYVTASVGISRYPFDGSDCATLIKNAAAAKYRAGNHGGNDYQFYTADTNDQAVKRLSLETSLRRAIENEEFVVFYQPKINLSTSAVVGVEALVRWQNPEQGLLMPAEFITVAEETGLIVPLGAWVLRTACAQVRAWQLDGLPDLRLAVNVSPRQFQQQNLLESVVKTLEGTGLNSGDLELELTESSIMRNAASAAAILRALKDRGVKIAVDDFGTGHSSLGYLRSLPLDVLKIDRSFVHNATTNADDAALVTAIITLAHSLRLEVIAEGVETEEHLHFLRLLRCDEGQGYLFGKAMPADLFRSWMAASRSDELQFVVTS